MASRATGVFKDSTMPKMIASGLTARRTHNPPRCISRRIYAKAVNLCTAGALSTGANHGTH
jgi:hypothetical protein